MENKELEKSLKNIRDGINKIIRESNCKNNDFMKRMYEKRDKLKEQEEKEKK